MAGAPKGNKNGATGAMIKDAFRYHAAKLGREIEGDDPAVLKGMRRLAMPVVEKALEGDMTAFKEIADRVDGKPTQAMDIDADLNFPASIPIEFVKTKD